MSSIFSTATSALSASMMALQTTSHNIANASTPGYSRQQVLLESVDGRGTGSGFFGRGVEVATVARAYDRFLTQQAGVSSAQAMSDSARLSQLEQLEDIFPTGSDGLGQASGALLNAFADVAANPQDPAARQVVLSQARELAARFQNAGDRIDRLQAGVFADVRNSVESVNGLAARIASLNDQIARAQGSGHAPNDLLDQRDQAISQLNDLIQVTTIPATDGTMGVFVGGGQHLVLGTRTQKLQAVPSSYDPAQVALSIGEPGATRPLPANLLTGGAIAGLMRFQDEDLSSARNLVGQMAASIAGAVNGQQALGLDQGVPPGAGAPIFAAGAPQAVPNLRNARDANDDFVAALTFMTQDASSLRASDYELRTDPNNAGGLLLTRLSDGHVEAIVAANADDFTFDGFRVQGGDTLAGADRFLLRPVGRAAADMEVVLADPRGIAAASPFTATTSATNTGTAGIGALKATGGGDVGSTVEVEFQDDAGAYDWVRKDSGGNVVENGSGQWTPGEPLKINGFSLSLTGVPRAGDGLQVSPTRFAATNGGNAQALLDLRDATMVGGQTVTDAYASAIANIGVRVQNARSASDISTAVAQTARTRLANTTGVNLDEEAARLIQYQQSYQAAARVLQVAQSVFDTLLQMGA